MRLFDLFRSTARPKFNVIITYVPNRDTSKTFEVMAMVSADAFKRMEEKQARGENVLSSPLGTDAVSVAVRIATDKDLARRSNSQEARAKA